MSAGLFNVLFPDETALLSFDAENIVKSFLFRFLSADTSEKSGSSCGGKSLSETSSISVSAAVSTLSDTFFGSGSDGFSSSGLEVSISDVVVVLSSGA